MSIAPNPRPPLFAGIDETAVRQIVLRLLELSPQPGAAPPPDATPIGELARDSFALLELCFRLQEELPVILEQTDLGVVHTLGDLVRLVTARAAGR